MTPLATVRFKSLPSILRYPSLYVVEESWVHETTKKIFFKRATLEIIFFKEEWIKIN